MRLTARRSALTKTFVYDIAGKSSPAQMGGDKVRYRFTVDTQYAYLQSVTLGSADANSTAP